MPDGYTYALFVTAALALLLVPGPSVLYVVARSLEGGKAAGLVSCLGIGVGTLVHVTFAAVGLSALVASSAIAFSAVKWLGVAYLVWLGLTRIFEREDEGTPIALEPEPLSRVFAQGVLVNILNPKTALFFLAFLPQFVDTSRGPVWAQILVFGVTLVALGLLTDSLYALLGGSTGGWLRRKGAGFRRARRYVSGGVYLALGAIAAATGSGRH